MCLALAPAALAAISGGVGIASQAMGYLGQRRASAQQEQYNQQVYQQQQQQAIDTANFQNRQVTQQNEYIAQNRENALRALRIDQEAMVSQGYQESVAASLETEQNRIEAMKSRGSLQASEKQGVSLGTLLSDFYRQEAMFLSITENNLAFTSGQRQREGQKLVTTAQSRVNEARPYESAPVQTPYAPAPTARPSALGALVGIAGSGLNAYSQYSTYDPMQNRYRIGSARLPSLSTASNTAPIRSFATGLAPIRPFQQPKGKN